MPETMEKKNTYITLHKNFVREGIEYTDKKTGKLKTFNSVTLPRDTIIDGKDVSGYQFSPLFVNGSKYRGEDYRDIPLLSDREVRLQKTLFDPDGNRMIDEEGHKMKDTFRVMPMQIKAALAEAYDRYKASKDGVDKDTQKKSSAQRDPRSLSERVASAREGSATMANIPFDKQAR